MVPGTLYAFVPLDRRSGAKDIAQVAYTLPSRAFLKYTFLTRHFFFCLYAQKKRALMVLRARFRDQKCDIQKINIFYD